MSLDSISLDASDALAGFAVVVAVLSWLAARRQNLIALHNERVKLYQRFRDVHGKLWSGPKDRRMGQAEQLEYLTVRQLSEFYFGSDSTHSLDQAWNALADRDAVIGQTTNDYRAVLPFWVEADEHLEAADESLKRELRKATPSSVRGALRAVLNWPRAGKQKRRRRKSRKRLQALSKAK